MRVSESVIPGGKYDLSFLYLRKLCRLTAARTILSAFRGANYIARWEIRNRLARIPNAFSATRLAREQR